MNYIKSVSIKKPHSIKMADYTLRENIWTLYNKGILSWKHNEIPHINKKKTNCLRGKKGQNTKWEIYKAK